MRYLLKLYRKILSFLVRRELRKISTQEYIDIDDLISYYDFMSIECMDRPKILKPSIRTSLALEELRDIKRRM